MWAALIPILGTLFGKIIDKAVPDPNQAAKLKAQALSHLLAMDETELSGAIGVIQAEAEGKGLKANWRPITMLVFVFIIANNYIIAPYMQLFTGRGLALNIPPDMWALLKIGLGGYVMGRSAEKAVRLWKSNS